jgi:rubrerythrin
MGIRDYLSLTTDGGRRRVHYECKECGTNLERDAEGCPNCDGEVAVYEL